MTVVADGRAAVTEYRVLERFEWQTYLEAEPQTDVPTRSACTSLTSATRWWATRCTDTANRGCLWTAIPARGAAGFCPPGDRRGVGPDGSAAC